MIMQKLKAMGTDQNVKVYRRHGIEGPMFGGKHEIRCLYSDVYSETKLMLEVDGKAYAPRTWLGIVKLIAKRLVRK